jgi:glutaminyl-tRNA synthetase
MLSTRVTMTDAAKHSKTPSTPAAHPGKDRAPAAPAANFLRNQIDADLSADRFADKRWAGQPATADALANAPQDPARIRTRFPPEPNGYLHIGHAKSICLNFGLARDYQGACHMRFDDTNPEKEDETYVNAILDVVKWLGFDWEAKGDDNLYHASDYFDVMYDAAVRLVKSGDAYVDQQSPDEMRALRGTLTEPGKDSPWRNRPAEESIALLQEMRDGKHPDGSMALRARIDMASPNINLRDPVLYRIRHAEHHRTGTKWCIYPMYTFAHPIEDALEGITHSICTLEFEDQRPFYDWLLAHLRDSGLFADPLPHQYEFARLNLTYVITSKRKLAQLVNEGHVSGWDDPRMPTLVGLRRRGYSPEALRLFCDRLGASKSDSWIDYSTLEQALREDLDPKVPRTVAVLRPLKLVITNYPEGQQEICSAPRHPHHPEQGKREFPFARELWIERDDFMEVPSKGFFRLTPDGLVRLKYGYVVKCTGFTKNEAGEITEVQAEYLPDTRSGTPGADAIKVKGNITWIAADAAVAAEFRLYDRLFSDPQPDAGGKDFLTALNPNSVDIVNGFLEPGTVTEAGTQWQVERLGYFVADMVDSTAEHPVINRVTTLKDSPTK